MTGDDWFDEGRRTIGMWIDGSTSLSRDRDGELVPDDSWLVLLHAGDEPVEVTLPGGAFGEEFVPVLDSGTPRGTPASDTALPPRAQADPAAAHAAACSARRERPSRPSSTGPGAVPPRETVGVSRRARVIIPAMFRSLYCWRDRTVDLLLVASCGCSRAR